MKYKVNGYLLKWDENEDIYHHHYDDDESHQFFYRLDCYRHEAGIFT